MRVDKNGWAIVYDKAIREDGSLFFPEKLNHEFLDQQKKTQGSYIFIQQYQNEVLPEEMQILKKEWLAYYQSIPENVFTFAFIDPAVGKKDETTGEFKRSDYTALAVVDVDTEGCWYLRVARRAKLTVTQQVQLVFDVNEKFKPIILGIEDVAYQNALIQLVSERMVRENVMVPVKGIKRTQVSKQARIRALVPRFEWRRVLIAQGLFEFEREYLKFPRAQHDDILDAVASINEIYQQPPKLKEPNRVPRPSDKNYESYYIQKLQTKTGGRN